MLILLDAISLAGSRSKQNDDSWGVLSNCAFVIDGATDLNDRPISGTRSDASWFSRALCRAFYTEAEAAVGPALFERAAVSCAQAWRTFPGAADAPARMRPLAAALVVWGQSEDILVLDSGDCRLFAWDGINCFSFGGEERRAESDRAASLGVKAKETLDLTDEERMHYLRSSRTFAVENRLALGLEPPASVALRVQRLTVSRPCHLLLATDGFAALVDVYDAYTPEALVRKSLEQGLAAMAAELRAIETEDQSGNRFARWKTSDDATAILLMLE